MSLLQLAHPVLEMLKSTDKAWLVDLLYAFNTGDIVLFEKMKPQWSSIADLAAQELKLRQKISLLCLMEVRNAEIITFKVDIYELHSVGLITLTDSAT